MKSKIISLLLLLTFVFVMPLTVNAATNEITNLPSKISNKDVDLNWKTVKYLKNGEEKSVNIDGTKYYLETSNPEILYIDNNTKPKVDGAGEVTVSLYYYNKSKCTNKVLAKKKIKVSLYNTCNITCKETEPFIETGKSMTIQFTAKNVETICYHVRDSKKGLKCSWLGNKQLKLTGKSGGIYYLDIFEKGNKANRLTFQVFVDKEKYFVFLDNYTFIWDGTPKAPLVESVYNFKSEMIEGGMFTVKYPVESVEVGKYELALNFNDGTVIKREYSVVPKTPAFSGSSKTSSSITLKWNAIDNVTGYQITRVYNGKSKTYAANDPSLTRTITGLKSNTKYSFYIRAYKTIDGVRYYSDYSKLKNVTTKKGDA